MGHILLDVTQVPETPQNYKSAYLYPPPTLLHGVPMSSQIPKAENQSHPGAFPLFFHMCHLVLSSPPLLSFACASALDQVLLTS